MQENRSFDHYYGSMSGVRGFSDPDVIRNGIFGTKFPVWDQFGYRPGQGVNSGGYMQPFHLQQVFPKENGDTTNDITHNWGPQHQSWNHGKMDSFVQAHLIGDGVENFAPVMGYFTRSDIPFYYALADAFTICDAYHCSVLGPDGPQPGHVLLGDDRPERNARRPLPGDPGRPVASGAIRQVHLGDHARTSARCRGDWKVYNDPTGLALFSPLALLQGLHRPQHRPGQALPS
jgi:phospholipase C